MPYKYNMDIQSLRAGFFKGGGNITALVENGSYSRYYDRYRGHITSRDQGSVYNFLYYYLPFPFLFFSFRSLFIDNLIIQAVYIPLTIFMP